MANNGPDLTILKHPLAIRLDYIAARQTTIVVKQDPGGSKGKFHARAVDGTLILSSDGHALSNGVCKEFKNNSGVVLFNLRSSWFSMSKDLRLEVPKDKNATLTIRMPLSLGKIKLDCSFKNATSVDAEGNEVTLEVRGQDSQHLTTVITYGNEKVAHMKRMLNKKKMNGSLTFKPEYRVDVVEDMDLSLISAIVIVTASLIQAKWEALPVDKNAWPRARGN